jgi:predicted enzyme related to lactoylglutathione lyase
MSGKIIGLGGVFIKSKDKTKLNQWYQDIFDVTMEDWGTTFQISQINNEDTQVFAVFPDSSKYFNEDQSYMINWMVDDLEPLKEKLKSKNIQILGSQSSEFGKFAWINDLDGNKLELWEPPKIKTNNTIM